MAELKTKATKTSVADFVEAIEDEKVKADTLAIIEVMKKATKADPVMWGPSIIGFGSCTLKYESGRELEWMEAGFSPRKGKFSLYIKTSFPDGEDLVSSLGKHTRAKGCIYVKKVEDIDLPALGKLVKSSVTYFRKNGYNA